VPPPCATGYAEEENATDPEACEPDPDEEVEVAGELESDEPPPPHAARVTANSIAVSSRVVASARVNIRCDLGNKTI
jgi:hypothetical protein